jgi:hypothetical protein
MVSWFTVVYVLEIDSICYRDQWSMQPEANI